MALEYFDITTTADVLTTNGVRTSTGTVLATKIIFYYIFYIHINTCTERKWAYAQGSGWKICFNTNHHMHSHLHNCGMKTEQNIPDSKVGDHLGPIGPRWAPCWRHEPCYLGCSAKRDEQVLIIHEEGFQPLVLYKC